MMLQQEGCRGTDRLQLNVSPTIDACYRMIIIRPEQMEAFHEVALSNFEREMFVHLRGFSPLVVETAGEAQTRKAIHSGAKAAAGYGFTLRGPVRLYLELMILFGSSFDHDPQYSWVADVLTSSGASEMQRADQLFSETRRYQHDVGGPGDAYTLAALQRLASRIGQPFTAPAKELVSAVLQEVTEIYPQKATYVGEEGLTALIVSAREEAAKHGFLAAREVGVVASLMFAFGRGCVDDPLYRWIARTLNDERLVDPADRANRLERRAQVWLEHALAHLQTLYGGPIPAARPATGGN